MSRKKRNLVTQGLPTRHSNRKGKRGSIEQVVETRSERGTREVIEEQRVNREDYNLAWFKPTLTQKEIIRSICENQLTAVQGSSGCGKSTTAIFQSLKLLKEGKFDKILFIKTPSEDGDDQIGFLTGDTNQKLNSHMESMRSIFHTFMTKNKLTMEEKRERIKFSIPNFEAGKTFYNSIVILDESQKFSPNTMKLLLERVHESSIVIVLGDKNQRYAAKKREDGFTDFIMKITEVDDEGRYSAEELMGYIEMTAEDNMRGELSRRIVTLYEE